MLPGSLITLDASTKDVHQRIRLCVPEDDVTFGLEGDLLLPT